MNDSLAHRFGPRFQFATDAEQRYLAAKAALGEPPYRTSDVATRYGAAISAASPGTAAR